MADYLTPDQRRRIAGGLDPSNTFEPKNRIPEYGLDLAQNAFLWFGRLAEKGGAYGTPLRLYNQMVQEGRTKPVTESDFTNLELDTAKRLILDKIKRTSKPSGHFTYEDYNGNYGKDEPAARNLLMSLGAFQYAVGDDGNIGISDSWDFNRDKATQIEGREAEKSPEVGLLMPTAYAAGIGRQVIPDGSGVPVSINIDSNRTPQPHPKDISTLDDSFLKPTPDARRRIAGGLMAAQYNRATPEEGNVAQRHGLLPLATYDNGKTGLAFPGFIAEPVQSFNRLLQNGLLGMAGGAAAAEYGFGAPVPASPRYRPGDA